MLMRNLRHLDLFSGIGGFALGARMAGGIETVAFCEIDPFCQRVLRKNFPGVPIIDDIVEMGRNIDLNNYLSPTIYDNIDIITGGYPCQPFSVAGRQKAKKDPRHLWPHMREIVASLRPAWAVAENVHGHITLGLDDVLHDLEDIGYAATALVVPALCCGTRHNRARLFIVAHSDGARLDGGEEPRSTGQADDDTAPGPHEDRDDEGRGGLRAGVDWRSYSAGTGGIESTEIRVDDGLPDRMDRCKSVGNSIDPRIAAEIFTSILTCH